jgi:hypothetical protein
MKMLLDLPAKTTVFLQLIFILFFSCSLYFYLQEEKASAQLQQQQTLLTERKHNIARTEKLLEQYKTALAARPDILHAPKKIQWEEVEFFWKDISFRELLHRLDGVYSRERTFTLEHFSLEKTREERNNADSNPDLSSQEETVGFKLRGYYLCLCR